MRQGRGAHVACGEAIARRRPMPTACSRVALRRRGGDGAGAGDRHRRALDPEDGRDRLRLRSGAAVRPQGGRAAAGAGAADAGRRGSAVPRAFGRGGRGRSPARGKAEFREAALFTHRGPVRARRSCRSRPTGGTASAIGIDFLPDRGAGLARSRRSARGRGPISTPLLGELLPDRLAEALAKKIGLWGELANMPDAQAATRPSARLADWRFTPERHRRLRQGRGHRRRHQHRRALVADDGSQDACRAST